MNAGHFITAKLAPLATAFVLITALAAQTLLRPSLYTPAFAKTHTAQARAIQINLGFGENVRLPAEVFCLVTLGYWQIAVDSLWIHAMLDAASDPEHPTAKPVRTTKHPDFYYDLMRATEIDPAFFDLYVSGANMLAIIHDDPEGARDVLIRGTHFLEVGLPEYPSEFQEKHWKMAWFVRVTLGYVYLFELKDLPSAGEQFQLAAEMPNAPEYLRSLSKRLQKEGGEYEVGLRLLKFMADGAKLPEVKARYLQQREWLEISQYLYLLNQKFSKVRSWPKFLSQNELNEKDPRDRWGGHLTLNPKMKKIETDTPREKVFGLE